MMQLGTMVVPDRRIRHLGISPEDSFVNFRVVDRDGTPIQTKIRASRARRNVEDPSLALYKEDTNGDGFATIRFPNMPPGDTVFIGVDLPEGMAIRKTRTTKRASGQVELFQSIVDMPKAVISTAEVAAFGIGTVLSVFGLMIKNDKAQDIMTGLGSGLFAIGGFSLVFRHLR